MKYLVIVLYLFSSLAFACTTEESNVELRAFAENLTGGYFEIYADRQVIEEGRKAKIDSIALYIKDKIHLRLKVEDASFSYDGYFVSAGMLNQELWAETTVIIDYDYGDLTMCGPQRFHKLLDLFDVEKPAKAEIKPPPPPKLPPHLKSGT